MARRVPLERRRGLRGCHRLSLIHRAATSRSNSVAGFKRSANHGSDRSRRKASLEHRSWLVLAKTVSSRARGGLPRPRVHHQLGNRGSAVVLVRLGQSRLGFLGNHTERQPHPYPRWQRLRRCCPLAVRSTHADLQERRQASMDLRIGSRWPSSMDSMERQRTVLISRSPRMARESTGTRLRCARAC